LLVQKIAQSTFILVAVVKVGSGGLERACIEVLFNCDTAGELTDLMQLYESRKAL